MRSRDNCRDGAVEGGPRLQEEVAQITNDHWQPEQQLVAGGPRCAALRVVELVGMHAPGGLDDKSLCRGDVMASQSPGGDRCGKVSYLGVPSLDLRWCGLAVENRDDRVTASE